MDESRRAHGRWTLEGAPGSAAGEGEILIDDEGVAAGPVRAEFLDADSLADADRVLTLGLYPRGTLALSMLARRHETFAAALAAARDAARVAGLLAHGITRPETFAGAVGAGVAARPARLLVYATHVTVVPEGGDPFQVPFGAVSDVSFDEASYAVMLATEEATEERPVVLSRLGRRTEDLGRAIREARDAQGRRLATAAGSGRFADGRGVPARELPDFARLLDSWSAPERAEGAARLVGKAPDGEARLGLVELLDPDEESLAAKVALPENLAAFLLVPAKGRVVLEILSGPGAATYLFDGEIGAIGRDLQALHFRRRPLALTEAEAVGSAGRPYRLALRRLEPLKRLRAATRARILHTEAWETSLAKALAG